MKSSRIKLTPMAKPILREWVFIIVSITSLMYLYYFVAWWGQRDYLGEHVFDEYFDSGFALLEILIQGVLFGIMFGLTNLLVDNTRLRKQSFGAIILFKTVLYTTAIALSQLVVYWVYHYFGLVPVELLEEMQRNISVSFMIAMSVYFTFVILLISFLVQINRKFGYGELRSMIFGKYHKPRRERRIFMFLDMKDSTGNAERLGHFQYSRMIQSCIHDLTDLIIRYKAQVYQYVGDEVVLTWPTREGMRDLNFINLYYAFEQRLNDKKDLYTNKYNMLPEFKAGVDEGIITATEVGDIKREIAYHGEVLHTAARLEKMCNRLNHKILITQKINTNLKSMNGYGAEYMGEFQLRGKEQKEKVYGMVRRS
jgi:adenylate cyclase